MTCSGRYVMWFWEWVCWKIKTLCHSFFKSNSEAITGSVFVSQYAPMRFFHCLTAKRKKLYFEEFCANISEQIAKESQQDTQVQHTNEIKHLICFLVYFCVYVLIFLETSEKKCPFLCLIFYLNKKNKNKVLEETSKQQKETWYHNQLYFYLQSFSSSSIFSLIRCTFDANMIYDL